MKRFMHPILIATICIGLTATSTADEPASASDLVDNAYQKTKTAKSEKDYAKIIELLERAINDRGLTDEYAAYAKRLKGWAHNRLGEGLVNRGRETPAMAQFKTAVRLNPGHWKARHNRGVSHAVQGKYDEAIKDFGETIRLNEGYANAWFNRGEAYYKKGELAAAMRDYDAAIRLDPEDAGFYFARGNANRQRGLFNQAVRDFDRSIVLAPDNADVYVFRGDLVAELGGYDQAAQDYREAIRLDNESSSAYRSIAWLMATCPVERFRDNERGVAAAKKAVKLAASSGKVTGAEDKFRYLDTLAAALANSGEYERALKMQHEAIKLAEVSASEDYIEDMQSRFQEYKRNRPYRHVRIASIIEGRGSSN